MPDTKCTLFFEQGIEGWTESYFLSGATGLWSAEQAASRNLATKRAAMLGAQGSITGFRLSEVPGNRLSSTESFNPPLLGNASFESDFADTALLLHLEDSSGRHQSRRFLRGNFDLEVGMGGKDVVNPTWLIAFNAFKAALTSTTPGPQWKWLGKDNTLTATADVTNVQQNLDGSAQITVSQPTFGAGPAYQRIEVFISGVQGSRTINGLNLIVPISSTVANTVRKVAILPFTNPGRITVRAVQLYGIFQVDIKSVVERKAGRPSRLSAGRQRVRVRG